jgi:hypothetical protein
LNTLQTVPSSRFFWIKLSFVLGLLIFSIFCFDVDSGLAVGIAPEEIYQQNLDLASMFGTWEKLPEINPLAEKSEGKTNSEFRTLLTLRKDGTCRVFDRENVSGSDGTWKHENHNMIIMLAGSIKLEYFVYGIKGDFMVTRSPLQNGVDQLWSRVK